MSDSNQVIIGIIVLGLVIFFALSSTGSNKPVENEEFCMMQRLTLQELRVMAEPEGLNPTQEDLDYFNKKPLCRDVCLEQMGYSQTRTDWYADEDLRATCKGIGIDLPE